MKFSITNIFGKLHPLVVHLPIGLMFFVVLFLIYNKFRKKKTGIEAINFGLALCFITAILSSATGWRLSVQEDQSSSILNYHKYFAIAFVLFLFFVLIRVVLQKKTKHLTLNAIIGFILISITGHFGGQLTHGTNYLLSSRNNTEARTINRESLDFYNEFIKPVFDTKCNACHNENKSKGGLILSTISDLKRGGDSGEFLEFGNLKSSLLSKRIHLPLDQEEHMPPTGKKQLTQKEIQIIDYWIENFKEFDQVIAANELSPEMHDLVFERNYSDLIAIPRNKLSFLKEAKGHYIVNEANNTLEIDLSGCFLNSRLFKKMKSIGDNIIQLKLSRAEFDSKDLKYIRKFKNLEKLFVDKTRLSDEDLKTISEIQSLKVLNVYGNPLSEKSLSYLDAMSNLEILYVWQTELGLNEIKTLQDKRTNLSVITGSENIFTNAQLTPPLIEFDSTFFKNQADVNLSSPVKDATIFYTLDGTVPDENSLRYEQALNVKESSVIKAICSKKGWQNSNPSTQVFVRNNVAIDYIEATPPNEKYRSNGSNTLFDLERASLSFSDGKWIGYYGVDCQMNIQLDESSKINNIVIGALQDVRSYIFLPRRIDVYISSNEKDYELVTSKEYPELNAPEDNKIQNFIIPIRKTAVSHIRIILQNQKNNPQWHQSPGSPSWMFLDEVVLD